MTCPTAVCLILSLDTLFLFFLPPFLWVSFFANYVTSFFIYPFLFFLFFSKRRFILSFYLNPTGQVWSDSYFYLFWPLHWISMFRFLFLSILTKLLFLDQSYYQNIFPLNRLKVTWYHCFWVAFDMFCGTQVCLDICCWRFIVVPIICKYGKWN